MSATRYFYLNPIDGEREDDLLLCLKDIPEEVNGISISLDILSDKSIDFVNILFNALPTPINEIHFHTDDNANWLSLPNYLALLPVHINQLNFSHNRDLFIQDSATVMDIANAIPPSVTHLMLSGTHIRAESPAFFAFINALHNGISHMDLSINHFGESVCEKIIAALKAMPESLNYLNLRNNVLCQMGGDNLSETLKAIPSTVTELDLSDNHLSMLFFDNDILLLKMQLQAGMFSLDSLKGSTLEAELAKEGIVLAELMNPSFKYISPGFAKAFSSLPKTIDTLHLLKEFLWPEKNELETLAGLLPQIKMLSLSDSLSGPDRNSYDGFSDIFPNVKRLKFVSDEGETLHEDAPLVMRQKGKRLGFNDLTLDVVPSLSSLAMFSLLNNKKQMVIQDKKTGGLRTFDPDADLPRSGIRDRFDAFNVLKQ